MGKIEEKVVEGCNKENCTKNFTDNDAVAELLQKFEAKENPSERTLVCIQHLKAIQIQLEREALDVEVVDSKIVE